MATDFLGFFVLFFGVLNRLIHGSGRGDPLSNTEPIDGHGDMVLCHVCMLSREVFFFLFFALLEEESR